LSALSHVAVGIAEFPGPWLGMAFPGAIWIDQDAAGYGWFLDASPAADALFPASPGSAPFGKVDLLTVVEHELGHEMGFADTTGDGLMGVFLPTGARRVPALDPPPGDSPGQGLLSAALPRPMALLPGARSVVDTNVLAALMAMPPDQTWTAPAALAAAAPGDVASLNSSAPMLPAIQKESGVMAAEAPFVRRATLALGTLDVVVALEQDPLLSEVR
jgi:hypothetical protein